MAKKKLTIYVEEDVIKELKIEGVKVDKSIGEMLEAFWEKYKQEKNQKEK